MGQSYLVLGCIDGGAVISFIQLVCALQNPVGPVVCVNSWFLLCVCLFCNVSDAALCGDCECYSSFLVIL